MTDDLRQRFETFRMEIDADVAERHLAAIERELAGPIPTERRVHRRVGRLVVALAAAMLLLFPVAAIAAETSLPGDTLYPVKRSVEWVWSRFEPGIRAQHRIDELERALDRGVPLAEARRLLDAAEQSDASSTGLRRLEQLRMRLRTSYGTDAATDASRGPDGMSNDGSVADTDAGRQGDVRERNASGDADMGSEDMREAPPTSSTTEGPGDRTGSTIGQDGEAGDRTRSRDGNGSG